MKRHAREVRATLRQQGELEENRRRRDSGGLFHCCDAPGGLTVCKRSFRSQNCLDLHVAAGKHDGRLSRPWASSNVDAAVPVQSSKDVLLMAHCNATTLAAAAPIARGAAASFFACRRARGARDERGRRAAGAQCWVGSYKAPPGALQERETAGVRCRLPRGRRARGQDDEYFAGPRGSI
ncbi:hypothetical protein M885DRAFT_540988, partial [Pelagophyceae sp. CCMP2097]